MVLDADDAENVIVVTHTLAEDETTVTAADGEEVSRVVPLLASPRSTAMWTCAVVAERKFSRHSTLNASLETLDARAVAVIVDRLVPATPPHRYAHARVGVPVSE